MVAVSDYVGGSSGYLVIVGSLGPIFLMGGVMYLSNRLVKRNRAKAERRTANVDPAA